MREYDILLTMIIKLNSN